MKDPVDERNEKMGIIEYGLILILAAVVVIAVLTLLGPQINNFLCRNGLGPYLGSLLTCPAK